MPSAVATARTLDEATAEAVELTRAFMEARDKLVAHLRVIGAGRPIWDEIESSAILFAVEREASAIADYLEQDGAGTCFEFGSVSGDVDDLHAMGRLARHGFGAEEEGATDA